MKINPDGTLSVKPGEQITITINATQTPYQVGEPGNPCDGAWVSRTGPNPRVLVFDAPMNGVCAIVLAYRFVPDATGAMPAGAQYKTKIAGDPDEDTFPQTVTPPPNEQDIAYNFRVAQAAPGGATGTK